MKKQIIIRQSDFVKYNKRFENFNDVVWEPITENFLKKRATWFAVKGNPAVAQQFKHYPYPQGWIRRITNLKVFSQSYRNWLCRWNEKGQFEIRPSFNLKASILGIMSYEED